MIIFKIIRTELQKLFYSPVAWFLTILFLVQCAYFYLIPLYPLGLVIDYFIQNGQIDQLSNGSLYGTSSTTKGMFFQSDGIIEHVYQNLYLFIPLLTMGVISREINNGTIKLLYSSPIKLRQIILGKYLAIMAFVLLLMIILGYFMVLGAFHIRAIDYGLFLSALLGLILLAGAYSAIGIFMSSLTNYQIISGVATFTLFFLLSRIGGLWQQYDFVRDLTWFLSLSGRIEQMLAGLITTRDIFYFAIIIVMFLSFTLFKLKGERESKPWTIKVARYVSVIVVSLMLGYVTSRPRFVGYLDATAANANTISPATQGILKKMGNEPLEITLYGNLLGPYFVISRPENRNFYLYGLWDQYLRFKPDITFKYVYYYDNDDMYAGFPKKTPKQVSGIMANNMMIDSAMFMPPSEIRKLMDPYSEDLRQFMTVKYKGDTINLRTYNSIDNPWPNQQEIASKFKRLIEKKGPKVYFITGNLERSIYKTGEREYFEHTIEKTNRKSLVNAAFDVDTLLLETQDIPADATGLVLADPRTELGVITRKKLEQYIARGGNLMVLGEPGKQAIINPVLQQLGVRQLKGQLVQTSNNETPDKITPYSLKSQNDIIQQDMYDKKEALESKQPDTSTKNLMVGAAALSYDTKGPFKIKPIWKTLPDEVSKAEKFKSAIPLTTTQQIVKIPVLRKTWLKMGRLVVDSVPPSFNPEDGDIKDSAFVTAISLTRQVKNKQQRAFVFGDADCMSKLRGPAFGTSIYNWFDYGQHPVLIPKILYRDNMVLITSSTAKTLIIISLGILPVLMLLTGTILLIRRKRK